MNYFDPVYAQLFISSRKLYNIRSTKSFQEQYRDGLKIKIDGLHAYQIKYFNRPDNIYNQNSGIFIIDGESFNVRFIENRKPKTLMLTKDIGIHFLVIREIIICESQTNPLFNRIRDIKHPLTFSFGVSVDISSIDTAAAMLLYKSDHKT